MHLLKGVKTEGIESTLTEDIDARGTLGLKEDVRNGYEKIKVMLKVTSNTSKEKERSNRICTKAIIRI